jgi:Ca2+/Na+ antiporter
MAMLVSSVNVRGLTGRLRAKSCSHSIEMKVRTTVVKRKTFISLFTVQIHKVTAIYDNQRTIINMVLTLLLLILLLVLLFLLGRLSCLQESS